MNVGIIKLFIGDCGRVGYYNVQEVGLAKALCKQGMNVKVFLLDSSINMVNRKWIEKQLSLVYIPAKKIGSHGIFDLNLLKQFNIDVMHVISDVQLFAGQTLKWCAKNNIKTLTYFGTISTSSGKYINKIATKLIMQINKIQFKKVINIAKNPKIFEEIKTMNIGRTELIPVGLDDSLLNINYESISNDFRNEYKISKNLKVISFIGRLEEIKNPIFMLKLFQYINSRDENYHLVMVGKGALQVEVDEYIKNNNLSEKVTVINEFQNSDMWKVYRSSDVFLNVCNSEIFGMCILEAMYHKCPVIALKAPGPNFIIDNKVNGYLIDNLNYEEWYKAIIEAVNGKQEIVDNAKDKIQNELTWDAIANKYIDLYREELKIEV